MTESPDHVLDPDTGKDEAGHIIYNQKKKQEKLLKQAVRAHEYRVQIWAQSEQRIATLNAQLVVLGVDPYVPFTPDFEDPKKLNEYIAMELTK